MKSKAFLRIGSCLLLCLTGFSFSSSFCMPPDIIVFSGDGSGDPTPLPPNPPPPPPPLEISFGVSLL